MIFRIALSLAVSAFPFNLLASGTEPGLWQLTTVQVSNTLDMNSQKSEESCELEGFTPAKFDQMILSGLSLECETLTREASGNTLTHTLSCEGLNVWLAFSTAPDLLSGSMLIFPSDPDSPASGALSMTGKKIGECSDSQIAEAKEEAAVREGENRAERRQEQPDGEGASSKQSPECERIAARLKQAESECGDGRFSSCSAISQLQRAQIMQGCH